MNELPMTTLDEAQLEQVCGGVGECTVDDPNGDGVIDDAELEAMMLRANGLE
ncbi:MAG: hypothetical protein K0V04_19765 [Deltaproteobacteria bacterium]|nr:hypothetical protein [Deltaproteobacteria bacterium]